MHAKVSIKPTPDIDYVKYNDKGESGWGAHDDINSIGGSAVWWWNTLPHKCFGITSNWISTKSLPEGFQQKGCQDVFWQHHCSDIYK